MSDSDVITELDVLDPEVVASLMLVECGECGDVDHAMNLIYQGAEDDWLCGACDLQAKHDYDEYMRAARGW
jgi:hypothetical protein